jgi:hypothetical protein
LAGNLQCLLIALVCDRADTRPLTEALSGFGRSRKSVFCEYSSETSPDFDVGVVGRERSP